MSEPTLTVTSDFTKEFNQAVKRFQKDAVLVGIPSDENSRDEAGQPIGNAALLAINVFGSPKNNIPPRDVMKSGIKNAQADIAVQFKKAAQEALSKGVGALDTYYNRAGIIASNSIKRAINDQDWPPAADNGGPADSTLAARQSRGFKGTKSLVVTGQMRNAITYVVRSIWGK